jgi:general secretion pathway protein I
VKARGFTLIEVLVALAIVVVGIGALLGSMTSAAETTIYLRDKTFAQWIAFNRIAEVRLAGVLPAKGKTKGEVNDFAGRRWRWEQDVQSAAVPGTLRIDVSVRPAEIPDANKGSWYATEIGLMGDAVDYTNTDPKLYSLEGNATRAGSNDGGDGEHD